jgi:ABC-type glycerol-3-phosphate transport system substrate-binding protein
MTTTMQRHRFATLLAACLLAVGLAGCGDSGKPTLTFMYWTYYGASQAALNAALAHFKLTHKNLGVTTAQTPYGSAYYQKLIIMFGAQASPDVFFIDKPTLDQYASHGGLQDLTARVNGASLPIKKTDIPSCSSNGKIYGVPQGGVCYAISARSSHVDAAWDLLTDLVRAGYPSRK